MESKTIYTNIYGSGTTAEIEKNGDVIFSERIGITVRDMHVGGLVMVGLVAVIAENAPSEIKTMAALRDAAKAVLEEIKDMEESRYG